MTKKKRVKKPKPVYTGINKRSEAAKKVWEKRKEKWLDRLLELAITEGWTIRQVNAVKHSLFNESINSPAHRGARMLVDHEVLIDERPLDDLADFLGMNVNDLWGEIFRSYGED